MTIADLVSIRCYLADAAYDPANVAILSSRMGETKAARTVICARLLDPTWLIEVEAIAATDSEGERTGRHGALSSSALAL